MEGIVPSLTMDRSRSVSLPGLGKNTDFSELSQKRVTKAVRQALRDRFGLRNVEVSCSATFNGTEWVGTCEIDGERHVYRIRR
jgi:hypothetical protein